MYLEIINRLVIAVEMFFLGGLVFSNNETIKDKLRVLVVVLAILDITVLK